MYDEEEIKGVMMDFYRQFYMDEGNNFGSYPLQNGFPIIDNQILQTIGSRVSLQEVRNALFEMSPLKTPED